MNLSVHLHIQHFLQTDCDFHVSSFLFDFFMTKATRALTTRKAVIYYLIITFLILLLIFMTLKFSHCNVAWIKEGIFSNFGLSSILHSFKFVWHDHLTFLVLILSLISICILFLAKIYLIIFFLNTRYLLPLFNSNHNLTTGIFLL